MVLVIGEILFDIFSTYKCIGGAPFNFAFHMKKLGFPVKFISRVGDDSLGREILGFLAGHGFDLEDIQIDQDYPTGSATVDMSMKSDHSFIIAKNTAYDHIDYDEIRRLLSRYQPDIIYFGTLIQRTRNSFELFQKILNQKSSKTISFCDINLRPGCYTEQTITASLNASDILKLNTDELAELMPGSGDMASHKVLVQKLMKPHCIETMILTKGEKGSQWFTADRYYKGLPEYSLDIIDTVGAGDAYAAMSVAGILKNLPFERILPLAGLFAAHVCGIQGALIQDSAIYGEFKKRLEN
ncbi:PfkB family carbohydrate kinase [Desulfobacula sp.]|uniref:carbohydrate kinase family protein n=1 Tax=Desulfobacula sp. TaxID=2593537 RepID=UPI002607B98E|nr:PfkB family carbohydrate kinase [Desulfobacula sp.]